MTSEDPASRPNIQEALAQFEKILEELPEEEAQKEIFPLPLAQPSMQARLVKAVSLKTRAAVRRIRYAFGNNLLRSA